MYMCVFSCFEDNYVIIYLNRIYNFLFNVFQLYICGLCIYILYNVVLHIYIYIYNRIEKRK